MNNVAMRTNAEVVAADREKIAALPTIPVPSVSEHKIGTVGPDKINPAKWAEIQTKGDHDDC